MGIFDTSGYFGGPISFARQFFMKLLSFLQAGTPDSSIRLMAVMTIITCNMSLLMIVMMTCWKMRTHWQDLNYLGVAAVIAAIGTIIGLAMWGKNAGKSVENQTP